jgi:hypothetical protein
LPIPSAKRVAPYVLAGRAGRGGPVTVTWAGRRRWSPT